MQRLIWGSFVREYSVLFVQRFIGILNELFLIFSLIYCTFSAAKKAKICFNLWGISCHCVIWVQKTLMRNCRPNVEWIEWQNGFCNLICIGKLFANFVSPQPNYCVKLIETKCFSEGNNQIFHMIWISFRIELFSVACRHMDWVSENRDKMLGSCIFTFLTIN